MASELETILTQMIAVHRELLASVDAHARAVRALDVIGMEVAGNTQESCRSRIAVLENRRRLLVQIEARNLRLPPNATLAQIAQADPKNGRHLLALRDQLRAIVEQIAARTHVSARVTGAILGHLNTAVRLISGAVQQAGVYTKHGTPRVSQRIGMMEAVA